MRDRDSAHDVRRPDLLGVQRMGSIQWYSDDKGSGRIAADDGEVLWFHHTVVRGTGYHSFQIGERVSFMWEGAKADNGRHAAVDVCLER